MTTDVATQVLKAIDVQCALNREHLPSSTSSTAYLLVDITPSGVNIPSGRLRINSCLLIDSSGSMYGKKLKNAKEGAKEFFDYFKSSDYVAVISFEAKPHLIVEGQHITDKDHIKSKIDSIKLGSRTFMYTGLQKAFKEILNLQFTEIGQGLDPVRRLILLSDGKPTDGVSISKYKELAKDMRKEGITITCIGIGDYDERYLQALADNSGGRWYHIKSPEDIKTLFNDEFGDMKTVVAPNTSLVIRHPTIAEVGKIYKSQPTFGEVTNSERAENEIKIPLSDLKRGKTQQIVVEIGLTPKIEGQFRIAEVILKGYGATNPHNVVVTFTSNPELYQRESFPLPAQIYREAATRTHILNALDGDKQAKKALKTIIASKAPLASETVAMGTEILDKGAFTPDKTKEMKQKTQINR
ncbi:MAG: VWA domain-containing protein [Candidatus Methanofastidiosia archaeon]